MRRCCLDVISFLNTITDPVHLGVIVLGKTNMDEFGMGSFNVHSAYGAAVNPHSKEEVCLNSAFLNRFNG